MSEAEQLDLFHFSRPHTEAHARRTDPDTSKQAAASVRLSDLESKVLAVLRARGDAGATLDEIVEATGLDKVTASPRLRPLVRKGFAVQTSERRTGASGRPQTIWKAATSVSRAAS